MPLCLLMAGTKSLFKTDIQKPEELKALVKKGEEKNQQYDWLNFVLFCLLML